VYISLCYSRPRTSVSLLFSIFLPDDRQHPRGPSEHVVGAEPTPYHFRRRQNTVYRTYYSAKNDTVPFTKRGVAINASLVMTAYMSYAGEGH
jgi:hypothetical protein